MSIIFGIDFGTTNSCISYFDGVDHHVIVNEHGNYTTPSCIWFSKNSDEIIFGETALLQNNGKDGTLITNIKRLFGIPYNEYIQHNDLQSFFKNLHVTQDTHSNYCNIVLQHNNTLTSFSIVKLVQMYINWLINTAKRTLDKNTSNNSIVITVPVEFDHNKRNLIKSCLQNIGFTSIKIINEPTAATLAYIYKTTSNLPKSSNSTQSNQNVLVIDCGGGTSDFTILETDYTNMYFEVLENIGEPFLGGEDLTNNLVNRVLQKLYQTNKINKQLEFDTKMIRYIRKQCERSKRNLTYRINDTILLENINDISINISRAEFEMCNHNWFAKLTQVLTHISEKYTIDKIIFVGGATVTPKIASIVRNIFENVKIYNNLDPDHTVSIGAAIQGYLLYTDNEKDIDITFVDTLSMTLGIETTGGFMTPIISKNTMLPCSRTETFVTTDEENSIDINVYQGERRFVKDNSFLGTFSINRGNNNKSKVIVTFDITSDGLFIATAQLNENDRDYIENSVTLDFNKSIDQNYCYTDDFDKIDDTELANLITAKIELNNTLQTMKSMGKDTSLDKVPEYTLLIENTKQIIQDYKQYTFDFLENFKTEFLQTWWNLHKKHHNTT
jgi:molecular chaperone DnaK (HSP70)